MGGSGSSGSGSGRYDKYCGDSYYRADGDCDDFNNNAGCDWDGGDCCASTSRRGYVSTKFCSNCACLDRYGTNSGANATADYYYNATSDYNATADDYANQKYELVYHGRCQSGFEIKSISECSAAAKALGASDYSVESDGDDRSNSNPPFCYYNAGKMKFNAGNNKGYCSSQKAVVCLCVAAPTTTSPSNTSYSGNQSRCGSDHYEGDGDCDDENNNAGCDWDGGDCCASTSRRGYVYKRYCSNCACLDPDGTNSGANYTGGYNYYSGGSGSGYGNYYSGGSGSGSGSGGGPPYILWRS